MKILYDHQAFTIQRFGGVSKCFCELIGNMPDDVETRIAVRESDNVHLMESRLCTAIAEPRMNLRKWKAMLPFKGSGLIYRTLMRMGLLSTTETANKTCSEELLKEGDFDVFHPTFFDPYFLRYIGKKPWVITVHDMIPELFPEYFGLKDGQNIFRKKHLKEAAALIAVSEQTKKDVVRLLDIPEEKITVVYHAGPEREKITAPSIIGTPYILYVGIRYTYKNFPQTLADFADFHRLHPEVRLVCTGNDFTVAEQAMMEKLNIKDAVMHVAANGREMKILYAHAVAFVYPSLYEGFGMPILEAFAYGCPVLLNQRSCFPEIAADAGIYFDSEPGKSNLTEVMDRIYRLTDEERRAWIEKGYRRLGDFSWRKSAEKLAGVYREVCQKPAGGGNERSLLICLHPSDSLAKCA